MSTTAERKAQKALQYLQSAREVAAEMERLRGALGKTGLPDGARRLIGEDLNDATVRLCNLISLAMGEIDQSGEASLRARFNQVLDQVRGRWVELHLGQMAERVREIDRVVADTLSSGLCRLGLARRLEQAFSEVRATLEAMGTEPVEGLEPGYLDDLSSRISVLATLETDTFGLLDLNRPRGR